MEISIIPKWILKYLSSDYYQQYDISILISNLLIIFVFIFSKNSIIDILNSIPHFCLFDKLIGIECPVCGITRSFCEFSNGNFDIAFNLNSSSLYVALFFMLQVPLRIISLVRKNMRNRVNFISKYLGNTVLIVVLINWVIKLFR